MDRRERRRRARERKRLEESVKKAASRSGVAHGGARSRRKGVLQALRKTASGTKVLWAVAAAGVALLSGYSLFRPHVSVEPYIALNPANPYSTQFSIKNESRLFEVHSVDCVCWPRQMESGNGFSVISPAPLQKMRHTIAVLRPGTSTTIDCPPIIGGLGTWSGEVLHAELEIDVSYRQSWWPFAQNERYPFTAVRDVQKAVHWVHITPDQEKPLLPK
jgi:hypothetical protein